MIFDVIARFPRAFSLAGKTLVVAVAARASWDFAQQWLSPSVTEALTLPTISHSYFPNFFPHPETDPGSYASTVSKICLENISWEALTSHWEYLDSDNVVGRGVLLQKGIEKLASDLPLIPSDAEENHSPLIEMMHALHHYLLNTEDLISTNIWIAAADNYLQFTYPNDDHAKRLDPLAIRLTLQNHSTPIEGGPSAPALFSYPIEGLPSPKSPTHLTTSGNEHVRVRAGL